MSKSPSRCTGRQSGSGRRMRLGVVLVLGVLTLYGPAAICGGIRAHGQEPGGANPRSFEQLADGAQAAREADRIPEAMRLYERAVALRPSWSEGWWYLGTTSFDANQFREARDAFLHFVSVEHKQPGPGFGMLGLTEFQLKNYQKALVALERGRELGLGDNDAFVHSVLYHDGILNNRLGKPEVALVRLTLVANQVAAAHPEAAKESVLGDTDLLDAFGLAALRLQKLPAEIPPEQSSLIREAGHAQALIALQDRVGARAELKQLAAAHPSEAGVPYMYGVYLLKEDPPAAIEEFEKEIAVSPKHAEARIQLALEFLRLADYKQGLQYAQEAVALVPDNFVAHIACGKLWLGLGNTDRALAELRTAVRISPGSPDAHFALSRALSDAGHGREAAKERAEFERLKSLSDAADR